MPRIASLFRPPPPRRLTAREKAALAPYVAADDLDEVAIHEGHAPWYLPRRFSAVTRGHRVYVRPHACRFDTPEGLALLAHELVHVGQYRRGATWLAFLLSYLRHGYENSPLEREARATARRVLEAARARPPEGRTA
jgi:hypothetical protein